MDVRAWLDVLSFAGLAHGLLWALNGLVLGSVAGGLTLASRRVYRTLVPGAVAVALIVAATSVSVLWPAPLPGGLATAAGRHPTWSVVMALYAVAAVLSGYGLAHLLGSTWVARRLRSTGRIASWLAVGAIALCLVGQWRERPRLAPPTTSWKQPGLVALERRDRRPNIVLIVLDAQRVDRLGCYGYPRATTPRLDAFAADAMVFENCISPAIWTLPAHASMFTGLFPSEHGVNWNHLYLDDEFMTMAEILDRLGYQTMAFANNGFLTGSTNFGQGFDQVVCPLALHRARGTGASGYLHRMLYQAGALSRWVGELVGHDQGSKFTNQLVARWLDRRDRSRPFFLFINFLEPHSPYRPHLPHRRQFIEPKSLDASYRSDWAKMTEFALLKRDCYTPEELKLLNETYDAETRLQDDYVGEFLEVLASRAPLDDTLLIITADHGENLGDHHLLEHQWCVYDTLAHVPLIVRYPRRIEPGRRSDLVQTVDLLPTVIDAVVGRPEPTSSTFGRSLLTPLGAQDSATAPTATSIPADSRAGVGGGRVVVVERMEAERTRFDQAQQMDARFDVTPLTGVLRAVRQGPWKYIVAADGREELYHVVDDPGEVDNQIERHRPIAKHLSARLREWLAVSRPYEPASQLAGDARRLDDETRSRLRNLGYLQ